MTTRSYLNNIQMLRGLTAIIIAMIHLPFVMVGSFAVDIFFIISGFVVCYVTAEDPSNFYLKRIFRVVPLYWVGTIGIFLIAVAMPQLLKSTSANPVHFLKSMLFIPFERANGTVQPTLFLGWTLNYEMYFYLIFAIILAAWQKAAPLITIGVLAVIVALGHFVTLDSVLWRFWTDPILMDFAYGIAAYLLWNRLRGVDISQYVLALLGVIVASTATLFYIESNDLLLELNRTLRFAFLGWVIFMCLLLLEGRFTVHPLLLLIGDASYSLYLFHPYFIQLCSKFIMPLHEPGVLQVIVALFAVSLAIAFAIFSFRNIEKRSNRWLCNRFIKRQNHPANDYSRAR